MSAALVDSVRLKFTSANSVPVERAQITRAEIDAIVQAEREACAKIVEGICDPDGVRWNREQRGFMEYELEFIAKKIRARGNA